MDEDDLGMGPFPRRGETGADASAPATGQPLRAAAPSAPPLPPPQKAVQPGACPPDEHYLMQYNGLGRVACRQMDDFNVIDVQYHDISQHRKKMAPIRSVNSYCLAALAESGVLQFALLMNMPAIPAFSCTKDRTRMPACMKDRTRMLST